MNRRRKYAAVHGEGLRVVARLVRDAVWSMGGPEDFHKVLAALVEGFQALRIPFDGCGVYLIDAHTEPPAVLSQHVLREGRWRQALPGGDRDAAIALWRDGATTYVEDIRQDVPELDAALFQRFGHEVRSAVDVPFVNGLLTVTSRRTDAFRSRDVELLRDLAESLPPLYYRTEDLRQLEARDRLVERAQKLEMVGQLAAGTAHEVNNALTVILGQCELLLMDELEPAVRESLEIVLKAGVSTRALVARLMDLARGHEPQKQTLDLNRLVSDCLQLVRRQFARDGVEIVEQLEPHLPLVYVQAGPIQQVLLNLVQNSRDALRGGAGFGRIVVRTWHDDGAVRLIVEDDGPGVPRNIRERIFEPFFTTKEKGKGTGLGLSVCRTIAAAHGGDLFIQEPERGTRFVLHLPVADTAARTALN